MEPLTGHTEAVQAIAVGTLVGDLPYAVSRAFDRTLRVWDVERMEPVRELPTGHTSIILAVGVGTLRGRPVAASGGVDGGLRLWDLERGKQIGETLTGHTGWIRGPAFGTLNGKSVATTSGMDGTVRLWDLELGEPIQVVPVRSVCLGLAWVDDGRFAVAWASGLLMLDFRHGGWAGR